MGKSGFIKLVKYNFVFLSGKTGRTASSFEYQKVKEKGPPAGRFQPAGVIIQKGSRLLAQIRDGPDRIQQACCKQIV